MTADAKTITKFADKVEALQLYLGLDNSQFVYVLGALIHKKYKQIEDKEEE